MLTPFLALVLMAQGKPPLHQITLYGPHAEDLVTECREFVRWDKDDREGEPLKAQACLSYITGVFDGQSLAGGMNGKRFPVCVDSEVTQGQLVKVIVKYADDHPKILHELAIYLINEALWAKRPSMWRTSE